MAGIELERAVELVERLVVHAVAAQREAGDHVHVPVVGRGGEQVGDAVARRLLFAAREQHVDAVEIGLGRGGIELERLVEGAARVHDVNLAAESVARVLQLGDAEAGPARRKVRGSLVVTLVNSAWARSRSPREPVRTMNELSRARPCRYSSLTGPGSEPLRGLLRGVSRAGFDAVGGAQAVERGEDFVGDLGLHGDQVERSNADGAAGAHALRGDVEQLPVEIEALLGTQKAAREHEGDQQALADGKRVHLRDGQRHERAGWANHQRGNARQAGGDGIGEGKAVERRHFRRAQVGEGQDHQRILLRAIGRGLAKALGKHGQKAGGALLGFGAGGGQVGGGVAGNDAGLDLQRLHDGLECLAHLGGGGIARGRILLEAGRDNALQLGGDARDDFAQIERIGELDGANGLKVLGVGPGEGMTAADQLVENDAQRPHIGLHARLAGDKLLGRHVADGAAARGVGGGDGGILGQGGLGRDRSSASSGGRRRARPKSRILARPPSVSMTFCGFRSR